MLWNDSFPFGYFLLDVQDLILSLDVFDQEDCASGLTPRLENWQHHTLVPAISIQAVAFLDCYSQGAHS